MHTLYELLLVINKPQLLELDFLQIWIFKYLYQTQSTFLTQSEKLSFTLTQNNNLHYSFVYSNLQVLDVTWEDKRF